MSRTATRMAWSIALLPIFCCSAVNAQPLAPGSRPNLLLVVADDLGYADLGAFGSEIRTPHIDRLAATGLVLTQYYTAPLCSPTRAMLLSGTDSHLAGVGWQGRAFAGHPGYENYLNHRVESLASRLRRVGYHTYMAGKWHLGDAPEQSPAARGFERSFVLLPGGASHFEDMRGYAHDAPAVYREDSEIVDALPDGFYSTVSYTDRMIDYIDARIDDGQPFFGYLAYTAPHWPTHALDEDLVRQYGRYDEGYDVIRKRRFEQWRALGLIPADAALPSPPVDYVPWNTLSADEQAISARTMEAYAAMVERLDAEIGRLLGHLENLGVLDNTVVMFVSDNGAEGADRDWTRVAEYLQQFDNSLDNIGRMGSYAFIGPGWAEAGSAPFRLRKTFTAEGGIRVPAIVNAPGLGVPAGRSDALVMVSDIAATFLELGGGYTAAPVPGMLPVTGRSFAGLLRGAVTHVRSDTDVVAFEHAGNRALRRGDWKALWVAGANGPGRWELFNVSIDPGEQHDRAADHPDILATLLAEWDRYVADNGVLLSPPE